MGENTPSGGVRQRGGRIRPGARYPLPGPPRSHLPPSPSPRRKPGVLMLSGTLAHCAGVRMALASLIACVASFLPFGHRRLELGEDRHRIRILDRRVAEHVGDFVDQRVSFHLERVARGLELRDLIRRELELGRVVDRDDVEERVGNEPRHSRLEGFRVHPPAARAHARWRC